MVGDVDRASFVAGLQRAEEIANREADAFWNEEFARHGNKGLATMKQKVGLRIVAAIERERAAADEA